jgi:endonuclease/exonuclease/phosphatase family metal-dependent hydrolase
VAISLVSSKKELHFGPKICTAGSRRMQAQVDPPHNFQLKIYKYNTTTADIREIASFEVWKSMSQIDYSYVKPDGRSSGKRRNPDFHDLVLWQKSHATCLKIS